MDATLWIIGGIVIGTLAGAVIVWLFCLRKCARCSEAHYEKNFSDANIERLKQEMVEIQERRAELKAKGERAQKDINAAAQAAADEYGERR